MLRQYQDGKVRGVTMSEGFLVGATALMEVPMSMVFLSTALSPRASRVANVVAGSFMTAVQTATIFVAKPTSYYWVSSIAEITTTGFIATYALFAMKPLPRSRPSKRVRGASPRG
jgi:hypothetical protein